MQAYSPIIIARYGKTKFRVIVSAVMIIATIIPNIIHMPQMPKQHTTQQFSYHLPQQYAASYS